jgi:hypothetical protein
MKSKIFTIIFVLFGSLLSFAQTNKADKILEDWMLDTLGCLGYRDFEKATFIMDSLDIVNKSKEFVLEKLGVPNFINIFDVDKDKFPYSHLDSNGCLVRKTWKEEETFGYYYNTKYLCIDGKFDIEECCYCCVFISIILNKVVSVNIPCFD